ncbi:MAG TPA: TIGR04168 family protein, partial [Planctomycetes bacterium]|nr:TIGR04168 family protein [Planctomycetota bacterium]
MAAPLTPRTKETPATLLAVGDIHRCWREVDSVYLERTQADLTMFVGDFGDEDVEMVTRIANLAIEKAVILGNHDAWLSFAKKEVTEKLHDSLDVLGEDHIAYTVREVPAAGISIVGARPFSWGGQSL